MIEIKRKNLEPLVFEEATTVKEAVEYAVRNGISLQGADLSNADLSDADLECACFRNTDLSGADLTGTDLSDTDLREANVFGADLSRAYLRNADLSGADIDFSCWPLWYGSLDIKVDKRIFCQLLYHVLCAGKSVDDEEVKKLFSIPEVVKLANQFHHVCESGKILQEEKTE